MSIIQSQNKGFRARKGCKRIRGRKRHIIISTWQMRLNCFVVRANMTDTQETKIVLAEVLEEMYQVEKFREGFMILPKRLLVEYCLSWLK